MCCTCVLYTCFLERGRSKYQHASVSVDTCVYSVYTFCGWGKTERQYASVNVLYMCILYTFFLERGRFKYQHASDSMGLVCVWWRSRHMLVVMLNNYASAGPGMLCARWCTRALILAWWFVLSLIMWVSFFLHVLYGIGDKYL